MLTQSDPSETDRINVATLCSGNRVCTVWWVADLFVFVGYIQDGHGWIGEVVAPDLNGIKEKFEAFGDAVPKS